MLSIKKGLRRLRVRLGRDGTEIVRLHRELEGQVFVEEAAWLYNAARGRRWIVEIGSYRGKSAVILAKGSSDVGGRLLCIDPHIRATGEEKADYGAQDLAAFHAAVTREGVAERITKLDLTSREARSAYDGAPIDLLWIDGDHSYEGVKHDLSAWKGLVRTGGVIAAHDYSHLEAVRRAWREEIQADPAWGPTRIVRSIASAVRKK